jgi:hypothetical protein
VQLFWDKSCISNCAQQSVCNQYETSVHIRTWLILDQLVLIYSISTFVFFWFYTVSASDEDKNEIIDYYQYRRIRREHRKHLVHPYIRENANSGLFIVVKLQFQHLQPTLSLILGHSCSLKILKQYTSTNTNLKLQRNYDRANRISTIDLKLIAN